jgi:hypothetical protein
VLVRLEFTPDEQVELRNIELFNPAIKLSEGRKLQICSEMALKLARREIN